LSCSLILGSAKNKPFVANKKIGILTHQKTSSLQEAILNNAFGIMPGKLGSVILVETKLHLTEMYPHIQQIDNEKVNKIQGEYPNFTVITNKNSCATKIIVLAMGYSNTFAIEGLMRFVEKHQKAAPEKQRIQLKNIDHKVEDGIYVVGTLARWRSQLSIAAVSGASVATDILTFWNNGYSSQSHDKI